MMSGTDWEEPLDGKTVEQAWTTVRSQIDAAGRCMEQETMEHLGHNRES